MKTKAWPMAAILALACTPALAQERIGYTASDGTNTSYVTPANPLPAMPPQAAVTETTVTMTGLWVKAWSAASAKRVIIGLPSDSGASGDYSFSAGLSGASTSGGVPFAAGAGGSFDFAGGAVPGADLYVKGTSGSKLTVQVFN